MSWLEFIAALAATLAWPVAIIVCMVIVRHAIDKAGRDG